MLLIGDFIRNVATVAGVSVDDPALQAIVEQLEQDAGSVGSSHPHGVGQGWFGGSTTGGHRLATNASMAHDEAVSAFRELEQGLRLYGDAIRDFAADMHQADETAGTMTASLRQAADKVDQDFGD